ncbi:MAG: DUF1501 domain-containing protein [Planctomycetia bacterium]|nr:DUF1501 domain-containing protein [Planctomycetia bacterium]
MAWLLGGTMWQVQPRILPRRSKKQGLPNHGGGARRVDRGLHALVTDLHERGLDPDVAVVVWGEFGRTPKVGRDGGTGNRSDGPDHWTEAGFALIAGGGLRMGQAIGATDGRGGRPRGSANRPQNVLATLYHVLGIDPHATLPDLTGRPMYLLDDPEPIRELV